MHADRRSRPLAIAAACELASKIIIALLSESLIKIVAGACSNSLASASDAADVSCVASPTAQRHELPIGWLPRISLGLTIAERLRCAECGGPLQSVRPWRLEDMQARLGVEVRAISCK